MFAKKQLPPEPKLPEPPPVLKISEPEDPAASIADVEAEEMVIIEPLPSEKESNARLAQHVIAQALHDGAEQVSLTPVMYAPDRKALEVQYAIAGEWWNSFRIPIHIAPGLGIAFKALAGLPVWEHRMALEGLIVVQYGAADYDFHLSITPTRYGEKIGLRIEAV